MACPNWILTINLRIKYENYENSNLKYLWIYFIHENFTFHFFLLFYKESIYENLKLISKLITEMNVGPRAFHLD